MAYNGYATPVSLTPITVAFYVTNVKENGEDHEARIVALEDLTDHPNGDSFLSPGTVTGNGSGSAIPSGSLHYNRLADFGADYLLGGTGSGTTPKKVSAAHFDASNSASDGQAPYWNASLSKFTFTTPSSVAGVPSGLIGYFASIAALSAASGWSRYTAADGRIIACDGTVDSVTFTAGNNEGGSSGGTSWLSRYDVTGSTTISGNTGGVSALGSGNENYQHDGSDPVAGTHTHSQTGSFSLGSGSTDNRRIIPIVHTLIAAQKS